MEERAATMSVPGATTIGSVRPSTAGPRLDDGDMPRASSATNSSPGRAFSEFPTTIAFLHSCGRVIVRAKPPLFPAENTTTMRSCWAVAGSGSRTPASTSDAWLTYPSLLALPPHELFITRAPLVTALDTWSGKSIAAEPPPRTLSEPIWAPGATPRPSTKPPGSVSPVPPSPAAIDATWVPCPLTSVVAAPAVWSTKNASRPWRSACIVALAWLSMPESTIAIVTPVPSMPTSVRRVS